MSWRWPGFGKQAPKPPGSQRRAGKRRDSDSAQEERKPEIREFFGHYREKLTEAGPLSRRLDDNLQRVKTEFSDWSDLVVRKTTVGERQIRVAVCYVASIVDSKSIAQSILWPLGEDSRELGETAYYSPGATLTRIKGMGVSIGDLADVKDFETLAMAVLTGKCVILVDGISQAVAADVRQPPSRNVTEPSAETIIRGSREAFTESIETNIGLIRKRLKTPDLKLKTMEVGRRSKTKIALMYLEGVVNPGLVEEVVKRINGIDIDVILESGYIEQFIEDNWLSPFPQCEATERPDMIVAAIAQGKVVLLTDGSPMVLEIPSTLNNLMHSPEDIYQRWIVASTVRFLRFVATLISLTLPSFYIALTSYHPEMLPTELALTIGAARQGVPFPSFVEAFIMELALELLREAGIRLPAPMGQTVGIVGGLVVGEAAVRAGLVSPAMVVVVATTAIASFAIPNYGASIAFRLNRFWLMICTTVLGLYGFMLGLLVVLSHLSGLKTFGVSYMSPFAPLSLSALRDTIVRLPLFTLRRRASYLRPVDTTTMDKVRDDPTKRGGSEWG